MQTAWVVQWYQSIKVFGEAVVKVKISTNVLLLLHACKISSMKL